MNSNNNSTNSELEFLDIITIISFFNQLRNIENTRIRFNALEEKIDQILLLLKEK